MQDGAEAGEVQARVRRRIYLVDRKFQLKWTAIIVILGVLISAGFSFFLVRQTLALNESLAIDEVLLAEATKADSLALYYLIGFVVLMAVALFLWGIFMTHRVAGPIFIISRYLRQISEGEVPRPRPLRRGDDLQEFFEIFSAMLGRLKGQNADDSVLLGKAVQALKDKGAEPALIESLEKAIQTKNSWA